MTKDEVVGWCHRLNRHELGHALGDSEGQGSLACCSPWGCKESDMTWHLNSNNNNNNYIYIYIYTHIHTHTYREISFEELVAYIILEIGKSKIYRTGWHTGDPGRVDVAGQV